VHVVSKRHNTSIVTYDNQTWYVANIDFMTLGSDCLKDGQHVTLTGHIQIATGQMPDEKTNYDYPRLTLDKPVSYLGMFSEKNGRYVSLTLDDARWTPHAHGYAQQACHCDRDYRQS
jgi:hypothetical protein